MGSKLAGTLVVVAAMPGSLIDPFVRRYSLSGAFLGALPVPASQFSVNGLVELLPLDDRSLIAMERSFSVGAPGTGNTIKL